MLRFVPPLFAAAALAAPVTPPVLQPAPLTGQARSVPSAYLATRGEDGLFRVAARRDGRTVALVVDTGATQTILTAADARRLGVGSGGEVIEILTANGVATMRRVELAGLRVAGRPLPPLDVAVAETGLTHSLLGQDAIVRLGRLTIERDCLEIGGGRP